MESRVNKHCKDEFSVENPVCATRSDRNAKLYEHIYGEYGELDNLPIDDNINEIDMEKLRELVSINNTAKESEQLKQNLNILEQRKRRIDEQKLYDINKIIEKAKYENNKLKEPKLNTQKTKRDLLSTLGSAELSLEEIEEARKKYQEKIKNNFKSTEEELSTTRELKYKNLRQSELLQDDKTLNNTNSLSLDLFEDLKPTGNTIRTKPITSDISLKEIKSDIHSGDTSDIDIIKDSPTTSADDFFTNVYEFSKKDFSETEEDDFFEPPKKDGLFKIILLILAIIMFIATIIYFIGTYGQGIT